MPADDDKLKPLADLLKGAVPKKTVRKNAAGVRIVGNGNIVGDGNVIHHNFVQVQKVVRPRFTAPPGSISQAQAVELKALVEEIAKLEVQAKVKPRNYAAIWTAFKKRMNVTSYLNLPADRFDQAKQYLMQERGRLLRGAAAKSAPSGDFINARMKAIHARCREFPDGDQKRRAYMIRNFNAKSMTELNADQIDTLYQYVFGWKRSN